MESNRSEPPSSCPLVTVVQSPFDSFKSFLLSLFDENKKSLNGVDVGVQEKCASRILLRQIQNAFNGIEDIEKELKVLRRFSLNKM